MEMIVMERLTKEQVSDIIAAVLYTNMETEEVDLDFSAKINGELKEYDLYEFKTNVFPSHEDNKHFSIDADDGIVIDIDEYMEDTKDMSPYELLMNTITIIGTSGLDDIIESQM